MTKTASTLLMVTLAIAGLLAGFWFNQWQDNSENSHNSRRPVVTTTSDTRPLFILKDLDGKQHDVREWDGKVLMINFWASWCPPCRKEIPDFIRLQENYRDKGLVVVGIALDQKQAVMDFIDPMDINYPILLGEDLGIDLTKAYGNRLGVLPYTVIVDRSGKIIHRKRTGLTYEIVEAMVKPLL